MKSIDDIQKFLEQPIPRTDVKTRDGGRGKSLSYLESWRVVDLMNEAFGNLGWDSETVEMREVKGPAGTPKPVYVARVRIKAFVSLGDGKFLTIVKEGCGWGSDKSDMNPHEMAVKEAESDAFKRAAMKFGKRLGLALYDKTQEFVTDEKEEVPASKPAAPQPNRVVGVPAEPKAAVPAGAFNREACLKGISGHSKVLLDKKLATHESLVALLKGYGVSKKEDLNDEQAQELLGKLREMVKG